MIFTLKDWKRLRQPIVFLLAVVFLVVLLIYCATQFCKTQLQATQMQENLLRNARMQLRQYDAERIDRATFLPRYQALITQGFIGEEPRQTWVNALSEIQKNHHLFEIHYEIGRLTAANVTFLPLSAPFSLHQSEMKIRFALLHEGDLLTFANALSEKNLSPYIVKSCEITNPQIPSELISMRGNQPTTLIAQCVILWYTLAEPNGTQPMPQPDAHAT